MVHSNSYRKQAVTQQRHSSLTETTAIIGALVLIILISLVSNSGSKIADAKPIHGNQVYVAEPFAKSDAEQATYIADVVATGLFSGTTKYDAAAESAFRDCLRCALLTYTVGEDLARQYDSSYGSDTTSAECNREFGYTLGSETPGHEELGRKALSRYATRYQPIYQTDDINIYILIDRVWDALEDDKLTY